MTILIFFLVLFVLILVHEWGHFIVAKKTGMRVDEFGIGFPPKLFGIRWRDTEYTWNLFPIGGFVRILGENGDDGAPSPDSFGAKSKWAQAAVLVAGVTMNVILAWFLFFAVFLYGVPTIVDEGKESAEAYMVVTGVLKGSPADEAGITVGSTVVGYGGADAALTPSAFKSYTQNENNNVVTLRTEADGTEKAFQVTPVKGLVSDTPDAQAVGISLALVETVSRPLPTAFVDATKTTYASLVGITVGMGSLIVDIFQRDADLSQVAGPIGIVGLVGDAAEFGITSLLMFTAMISLNLAVINLLPFPALDGGRLVFVGLEALMRKPVNPVWMARINTVGFLLLLVLMVLVTINDITK